MYRGCWSFADYYGTGLTGKTKKEEYYFVLRISGLSGLGVQPQIQVSGFCTNTPRSAGRKPDTLSFLQHVVR